MKSSDQPPANFSMYPVNAAEKKPSVKPEQPQSPYLRAILSSKIEQTGRIVKMAISDKLAAIRYIQESSWRYHFSRG